MSSQWVSRCAVTAMTMNCCCGVSAEAASERAERLKAEQFAALQLCSFELQREVRTAEMQRRGTPLPDDLGGGDTVKCLRENRASLQASYKTVAVSVRKTKAKLALATAQVAFLSALDGIVPGTDELKVSYAIRQTALAGKLTEAWARFEVEQ